jgi:hypothetical protein
MTALEKISTLTRNGHGSMKVETASAMITRENAEAMFCKGLGDDPDCKRAAKVPAGGSEVMAPDGDAGGLFWIWSAGCGGGG